MTSCVWSAWEIEYSDGLVEAMAKAGHPISKRVGRFATKQECLAAIDEAVAQSGDPTLRLNMYPAPGGYDETGGSSSGGSGGTQEPVWGQDGYGIPFYNIIKNARQRAADRRAQTANGLNEKGHEQYGKGNWAAAAQFYREALKVSPNDPVIQQNLKNAEAREKARSLNLKGIAASQDLDWAAAARYFREALQATPDNPVLQRNLKQMEDILAGEKQSRIDQQNATRERTISEAAREKREAEQKRRLAQQSAAFADLQADAGDFLGRPAADATPGQPRVPLPPDFPVSQTAVIEEGSSPILELSPETYQIIGLVGKNIKEAPAKFGEAVISALGYERQLGVLKIAKGLSDEAGRSMQNAVDLIGRGYPEAETMEQIKGSESRALKIYVDSFSNVPLPPSEEEKQEMETNGRKWFQWLAQPIGGSR
jgi:tetratricopeptide (TPR) repeat protein